MEYKFTEKQKKIRENYKKKYGREMPLPKPMLERWADEEMCTEKVEEDKKN